MAKLVNVSSQRYEDVPDEHASQAILSGSHLPAAGSTVNVISPDDGQTYSIPAEYASHFIANGNRLETAADVQNAKDEAEYGDRPIAAALSGALRGATFGLGTYLGAKLGYGDTQAKLQKYNETADTAGEVASVLGSAFLPGPNLVKGVGLLGEGVAHAVAPVAERVLGGVGEQGLKAAAQRITGQAIAKGAGSAVEGALYGAGQTLSEDSLGNVQANGELLASQMGISALMAGAIGAAIPVAGGLLKGGSKLVPGWAQPGEDGYAVTKKINQGAAKLNTLFGGSENTWMKAATDAPGLSRAFAMGEGGATEQIRNAADGLATAAKDVAGEGYNLVDDKISELATNLSADGQVNNFSNRLHNDARDLVSSAQTALEDTPESFSAGTQKAVRLANNALDGMVPGLKDEWNVLRERVLDDHPGYRFANRATDDFEKFSDEGMGAFKFLPKGADPELQQEFARLQVKSVIRAKQEIQEALSSGPFKSFEGTATNEKFLLDLKNKLNDVALDIPGVGETLKGANAAYSSFKQDMGVLLKNLADRDGNVDMQKAINFVRSGGAKGEKVEDILDRAENYLKKSQELHAGTADPEVVAKLQKLDDSFKSLKDLRETGRTYSDLQELKRMAGPSGSGAGMIGEALAVASGHLNPALAAGLAPVTSPYYYFKGLNTLRQTLGTQINAQRLATIERVIGGQNKTIGDVAANSIKALARGTRIPAVLMQAKQTEADFKERQALLQSMQRVDPTELYQSIHNLVGDPAPAHAIATASVANRAVQYLQSQLPQGTEPPASAIAFEKKVALPSKVEMARFNSVYDTVENPKVALEALGAGTLKAEQVDALKTVYPQIYSEVSQALVSHMTNQPEPVPYQTRLKLGTWFGAPTTKELSPQYLQASQAAFAPPAQEQPQGGGKPSASGVGKITLGTRSATPSQAMMATRKT